MDWNAVRQAYPDRWLIIEALEAHTEGNQRQLERLAVVEECRDGAAAFQRYQALHQQYSERELYFVHTAREQLTILERQWLGMLRTQAAWEGPRSSSPTVSTGSPWAMTV